MEYKQIQELIKTINKSNISELSIEDGDFKITIKQEHAGILPVPVPQPPVNLPIHQFQNIPQPAVSVPVAPLQSQTTEKTVVMQAPASNLITIKSPMIGTFYRSPSPDKPPFISVGDEIKQGQVICIIEAMKLFNEIESEVTGKVIKVIADDTTPVEYDQALFLIEPA